jgi:hypothetical protein
MQLSDDVKSKDLKIQELEARKLRMKMILRESRALGVDTMLNT